MLYIVTPLSRPENLKQIAESFRLGVGSNILFRWYCVLDGKLTAQEKNEVLHMENKFRSFHILFSDHSNSFVGHSHRNWFLDNIYLDKKLKNPKEIDWVYFLDDDTLLHPDFLSNIISHLDNTKSAIIFNQENKDGSIRLRADINNVKVCHIDMGQYVVNLSKLPTDLRFKEDDYCADGIFIEELFNRVGPEQFLVINKTLSTYNKLR